MDAESLYNELHLWGQLQFPGEEDSPKTNKLFDNLHDELLELEKKTCIDDDSPTKIAENPSLGLAFSSDDNLIDDPLADWLDERFEIDEIVNSEAFDILMLDMSRDASSVLGDIDQLQLLTEETSCLEFLHEAENKSIEDVTSLLSPEHSVTNDECLLTNSITNDGFQVDSPSSSNAAVINEESLSCNSTSDVDSQSFSSSHPSSPEMLVPSPTATTQSRKSRRNCRLQAKPYMRSKKIESSGDSDTSDDFVPSDRKAKKRDQNKTAATRYRNKKRTEVDLLITEESKLVETNKQLSSQATQLQTEVNYLKNLMKEILIAKGILKK